MADLCPFCVSGCRIFRRPVNEFVRVFLLTHKQPAARVNGTLGVGSITTSDLEGIGSKLWTLGSKCRLGARTGLRR